MSNQIYVPLEDFLTYLKDRRAEHIWLRDNEENAKNHELDIIKEYLCSLPTINLSMVDRMIEEHTMLANQNPRFFDHNSGYVVGLKELKKRLLSIIPMYTPLQLRFIERFGDKTLTEGCYTIEKNGTMWNCGNGEWKKCYNSKGEWGFSSDYGDHMGKILGHEPHLFPDVARVAKELDWIIFADESSICIRKWREKSTNDTVEWDATLPLLDQPEVMEQLLEIFKK